MLKVNFDSKHTDYIDYLSPFLIDALQSFRNKVVQLDAVRAHIEKTFGLKIPTATIELCLKRLAKRGFAKKEHHQFIVHASLPESDLEQRRVEARRDADVVTNALVEFCKKEYGRTLTTEEAYAAIVTYLTQFSVECLSAFVRGTALPIANGDQNPTVVLVSTFVKSTYESADSLFDRVVNLVKGLMLSNALLCPDLESIQRRYDDVRFFLDTRLLFHLLGWDTAHAHAAAVELISLVRNLRGKIYVFSHTLDEIDAVLRWCEVHISDARFDGILLRELRRTGKTPSDVILMRGRLAHLIRDKGIEILPTPDYRALKLQIDEQMFEQLYRDEVPNIRARAVANDVNSVRSVYVMRMGVHPRRLEDALAVFVTTNAALARAAYDYGRNYESSKEVSTVITDFSLSNVSWLKAPVGAPNLPQREVIAYCYAALQPDQKFWKKYLDELDKLKADGAISEREHQLLRFSLRAEEELMKFTLGSDQEITGLNILEIRNRIVGEIASEKEAALAAKEAELARASAELASFQESAAARVQRQYWLAEVIADKLGFTVWVVGWVVLLLGTIYGALFGSGFLTWNFPYKDVCMAIVCITALVGFLGLTRGFHLGHLRNRVAKHSREKIVSILTKL